MADEATWQKVCLLFSLCNTCIYFVINWVRGVTACLLSAGQMYPFPATSSISLSPWSVFS